MAGMKEPAGCAASIATVFGSHGVSIARVVQKHIKGDQAELVIVTDKVREDYLKNALEQLRDSENIFEISSAIREY